MLRFQVNTEHGTSLCEAANHFAAARQVAEGEGVVQGTVRVVVVDAPAWHTGRATRFFDVRRGRVMIGSRGVA